MLTAVEALSTTPRQRRSNRLHAHFADRGRAFHAMRVLNFDLPPNFHPVAIRVSAGLELPRFVVQVLGNFSGCLSLACELVRRQVSERGMGSVVVVVAPPFVDSIDGISHRQEP